MYCKFIVKVTALASYDFFSAGFISRLLASSCFRGTSVEPAPRIQFLAIEIARNREGLNAAVRAQAKAAAAAAAVAPASDGASPAASAQ